MAVPPSASFVPLLGPNNIPPFDSLPLNPSDPPRSAWGLYGPQDQLGTLNRLTDPIVAAAAQSEIKTGTRVSLNWPLDAQGPMRRSFFQRAMFHQEIVMKPPRTINDDVWTFNSQISSQWDGLRHFGYQKEGKFYGGVTQDDIHGLDGEGKPRLVNGIHAWTEQGIVGRGILIDYHSWRASHPDPSSLAPYDSFDNLSIPLEELQACLASQGGGEGGGGTEIRFGDILFIRSGFMASHDAKPLPELCSLASTAPHKFGGVEQSVPMLRWIWDNFSAVAGDQPSFECWPTKAEGGWALHEILLAGWGCPIGELFDLEKLAEECKAKNRWSFFVSSEPCNVPGGVASPPNILAIF